MTARTQINRNTPLTGLVGGNKYQYARLDCWNTSGSCVVWRGFLKLPPKAAEARKSFWLCLTEHNIVFLTTPLIFFKVFTNGIYTFFNPPASLMLGTSRDSKVPSPPYLQSTQDSSIRWLWIVARVKQQRVVTSSPRILHHISIISSTQTMSLTGSLTPHTVIPTHFARFKHAFVTAT